MELRFRKSFQSSCTSLADLSTSLNSLKFAVVEYRCIFDSCRISQMGGFEITPSCLNKGKVFKPRVHRSQHSFSKDLISIVHRFIVSLTSVLTEMINEDSSNKGTVHHQ